MTDENAPRIDWEKVADFYKRSLDTFTTHVQQSRHNPESLNVQVKSQREAVSLPPLPEHQ